MMNQKEDSTIEYYNVNARSFIESTQYVNMQSAQEQFLKHLPPAAAILDFGCGSGRDTKVFLQQGFQVTATDGSLELCRMASTFTGIPVRHMLFQELEDVDTYYGIWACSSILHLSEEDLASVMKKMVRALKPSGIIYTSFKYGTFSGIRNGRYFTDFTEASFLKFMTQCPELTVKELWITGDVRPGRGDERWLNILLQNSRHEK